MNMLERITGFFELSLLQICILDAKVDRQRNFAFKNFRYCDISFPCAKFRYNVRSKRRRTSPKCRWKFRRNFARTKIKIRLLALHLHSTVINDGKLNCYWTGFTKTASVFEVIYQTRETFVSSGYPNTENRVKNSTPSGKFLTRFGAFG